MKESLKEKRLHEGREAQELLESVAYKKHQKSVLEKKNQLLKEVLDEKTIGEVRYKAGFVAGLNYLDTLLNQRVKMAVNLSKKN